MGETSENTLEVKSKRPKVVNNGFFCYAITGDIAELRKIVEDIRLQQPIRCREQDVDEMFKIKGEQCNMGAYRFYFDPGTNTLFGKINLSDTHPAVVDRYGPNLRATITKYADFPGNNF